MVVVVSKRQFRQDRLGSNARRKDVLEGGKASVCLSVSVSLRLLTDLAVVDVPRHAVASPAEQKRSESIAVPAEQTKTRAELRH